MLQLACALGGAVNISDSFSSAGTLQSHPTPSTYETHEQSGGRKFARVNCWLKIGRVASHQHPRTVRAQATKSWRVPVRTCSVDSRADCPLDPSCQSRPLSRHPPCLRRHYPARSMAVLDVDLTNHGHMQRDFTYRRHCRRRAAGARPSCTGTRTIGQNSQIPRPATCRTACSTSVTTIRCRCWSSSHDRSRAAALGKRADERMLALQDGDLPDVPATYASVQALREWTNLTN